MKPLAIAAVLGLTALSGCVAPVGPVEVTRFHVPDASALGGGTITVEPMAGMPGDGLEFRTYAAAVARQLKLVGYAGQARGDQVALLRVERRSYQPGRDGSPVSVSIGGGTGGAGRNGGVGVGIGVDLSGPPGEQVETVLAVTIKDRRSGQSLWEGRSRFTAAAGSPLANTQLGAAKMVEALFRGFPGHSGETILVR
jgi:hypothetical protein